MGDHEISEGTRNFFWFRCGGAIKTGEKMVTLSITVETPTGDDVVEVLEANAISNLCPA